VASDDIGLADAISSLRDELYEAVDRAGNEEMKFLVDAIEVELQVVAAAKGAATASAGIWKIITIGGSGEYSKADTDRVKVVLRPVVGADEAALKVNDDLTTRPR
jgi:hypothetical protein